MRLAPGTRWVWRTAALAVLALVFASYVQPDVVRQLAAQVWSCF